MLRRILGLALVALGAWVLREAIYAVVLIVGRGSPLDAALLEPPTSLIRILGGGAIVIGGVLSALNLPRGGLLALIGSVIFAALGGLLFAAGTDMELWLDEILYGGAGILLALIILALKRA
ncbi:MAG: hypothetical protein AAF296_08945 [Pseudomonadota bacterium]